MNHWLRLSIVAIVVGLFGFASTESIKSHSKPSICISQATVANVIIGDDAATYLLCSRPKFTGPCRAGFQRYYYDRATQKCAVFTYGGCKSNGNNFETEQECMDKCSKVKSTATSATLFVPFSQFVKCSFVCLEEIYSKCDADKTNDATKQKLKEASTAFAAKLYKQIREIKSNIAL